MNSTSNLADVVRHYQRSIEKHSDNEKRLVHCMNKLFNLPIKFEHLQETGIGKTVNALRKFNGEVGQSAKTLITKWKAMVTAEEGSSSEVPLAASSQEEDSGKSNGRRSSDEDLDQENKGSNSSSGEERHTSEHRSRHEERNDKSSKQERSGSSKSHSKSSSDSNRKHKSSRHDKSKERDKDKDKEDHKEKRSNGDHKSRDSSQSNSNKSSKSDAHKSEHSKSKHEKEKPHKDKSSKHHKSSSKSSKRSHSPQRADEDSSKAKIPKTKAKSEEDSPDGFDSSMGANFDDVLGMLNMPMSNKKSTSGKSKSVAKITASTSSSSTPVAPAATSRDAFMSSRPSSTKKPELLASSAKLEPLDPSIALELPTISNNYKPLPLNQTVMDVVFNQGGTQRSQTSRFNESEALAQGISSKTMRTKIYSGVRTGQLLQVPSLFDLCTRILQKNLDALEYTGGVPFEILRTVLERATPQQLLNIEEYNPYLMDDSDILWQQHVQRHCRSQRREEMETWREMFLRCQEEKDRKLSSLAESIKASQKISEAPVRKTQLAFVDSMVKPPRSVMRKQEQYGTKSKLIATPAARVAALSSVTPNAAKVGDARLRVLAATRDTAQVAAVPRNKKAPLMAKTLQDLMRGRQRR
ncbi:transcription elongation factor B polypeptide 3 [Drosophila serrata]|uniref:transcription elongation factor B polypeptide 3 n=1 Tax=Drosophila serrata TaxID=7274 RepID=UPI000A1D32FF|nr:transcription elongation factor B polypeptide 3 [Drosophila serrata]